MGFPYTNKMESLDKFLDHIAKGSKPTKADRQLLESLGLTSSNDRPLIPLFKALGFIDSSGAPTQRWTDYRDTKRAGSALAAGIKEAYTEIFDVYPDAYRKDKEAILNVIRANTDFGDATADFVYRTFQKLCENADFESIASDGGKGDQTTASSSGGSVSSTTVSVPQKSAPSIAINIQLELPKDADAETYDKLFAAMKKHLPL